MINYFDFLLEKKLEKLLLESKITFSKEFYKVLSSIKTPLSSKIISLQNKDIDLQYNYIDITDENDTVSFTPDRKVKEIIGNKEEFYKVIDSGRYLTGSERNQKIYDALNHIRTDDVYEPSIGTVGKIIATTIGSSGKIYCLFECTEGEDKGERTIINKEALEEYDTSFQKVWTTNRNKIKIGRVIRAIIRSGKIESNDAEIEKFVNNYKSTIDIINDSFNKFNVVKGDDILYWYSIKNYYDEDRGTLANSCMANVPDNYLYIYSANPDVCQLVILYSDNGEIINGKYSSNKIIGRALLWKTREGYYFMDRIYTTKDSDIDLFKKFAEKNGWWYKKSQNSGSNFSVENGTESKSEKIIVDLQKWEENFPYLDSIMYFNSSTGELSNDEYKINADYVLQSTSGNYDTIDNDD
jgi:hypothetical protein